MPGEPYIRQFVLSNPRRCVSVSHVHACCRPQVISQPTTGQRRRPHSCVVQELLSRASLFIGAKSYVELAIYRGKRFRSIIGRSHTMRRRSPVNMDHPPSRRREGRARGVLGKLHLPVQGLDACVVLLRGPNLPESPQERDVWVTELWHSSLRLPPSLLLFHVLHQYWLAFFYGWWGETRNLFAFGLS